MGLRCGFALRRYVSGLAGLLGPAQKIALLPLVVELCPKGLVVAAAQLEAAMRLQASLSAAAWGRSLLTRPAAGGSHSHFLLYIV